MEAHLYRYWKTQKKKPLLSNTPHGQIKITHKKKKTIRSIPQYEPMRYGHSVAKYTNKSIQVWCECNILVNIDYMYHYMYKNRYSRNMNTKNHLEMP